MPILKKRIVVHCKLVYKLKYNTNDCIEWYLWSLQVRMFIQSNTMAVFSTPLWIIMCLEAKLFCTLWKGTQTYDSYVFYLNAFFYYLKITFLHQMGDWWITWSFGNIHKMRGHWNQIGEHATCLTKHKSKSKNQNLPYEQTQHNDLIGFQTHLQFDLKKYVSQTFHNWNVEHLVISWKLIQID
jgi:hypothetical protein